MANLNKLAETMDRFAATIADLAADLKDQAYDAEQGGHDYGREVDADDDYDDHNDDRNAVRAPQKGNGPAQEAILQVKAGDLWKLANRSRKMIRFARQGKVPNQDDRAPLCRSIKTLKAQGLVRKPYDLRD